jgi:hypothetical protein
MAQGQHALQAARQARPGRAGPGPRNQRAPRRRRGPCTFTPRPRYHGRPERCDRLRLALRGLSAAMAPGGAPLRIAAREVRPASCVVRLGCAAEPGYDSGSCPDVGRISVPGGSAPPPWRSGGAGGAAISDGYNGCAGRGAASEMKRCSCCRLAAFCASGRAQGGAARLAAGGDRAANPRQCYIYIYIYIY